MSSDGGPGTATSLTYRPVTVEDLELLLAWRSNPRIYEHFRGQEGPLTWADHLSWFGSRPPGRHDYIIEWQGRRVGSVFLTPDSFVGVYVGEVDAWGEGIGSAAVQWLCETHNRNAFFAEIDEANGGSQRLFEQCGFTRHDQDGNWLIYRREG